MQRLLFFGLLAFSALRADTQNIVWVSPCTDTSFCFDPGNCAGGRVTLWEEAVTTCSSPKIHYSYKIDLSNNNSIDIQSNEDTLNLVLPVGTHQVIWRATDNCGNISQACSYLIQVKDCTPPSLLCISSIAQNLLVPDCFTKFNVSDFILSASDNCTPKAMLQFGMRRPNTGSGFPADTSLRFEKCEQGSYPVQIWVRDGNGLANSCKSQVVVQDNAAQCICEQAAGIFLQGCAHSADSVLLKNYTLKAMLQGTPLQGPPISMVFEKNMPDSCFGVAFDSLPLNGAYTGWARAFRTGNPLEGVSTFDLVLINRHILGQQPLENFYQVLAADVNQSKSISTFDIIEIRKLILGIYDSLPQAPAWRFIRPVPDPLNLLSFGEVRDTHFFSLQNLLVDTLFSRLNFVGVKMGDANANATLHGGIETENRAAPLRLLLDDRFMEAGREEWVAIRVSENTVLDGWQLALGTDHDRLEIRDIRGLPAQFVAWDQSGEPRISCLADVPAAYQANDRLFEVLVRAKTLGLVSEALRLNRQNLTAEAYPAGERSAQPVELAVPTPRVGATIYGPNPNPFSAQTVFSIELEKPGPVALEVFDLMGKKVFGETRHLSAGRHEWVLPAAVLPTVGVYAYRVCAQGKVRSGRLVRS
ncbi:MAG: hypothetical protein ABMA02_17720 [Saprospiraceae bacterium]